MKYTPYLKAILLSDMQIVKLCNQICTTLTTLRATLVYFQRTSSFNNALEICSKINICLKYWLSFAQRSFSHFFCCQKENVPYKGHRYFVMQTQNIKLQSTINPDVELIFKKKNFLIFPRTRWQINNWRMKLNLIFMYTYIYTWCIHSVTSFSIKNFSNEIKTC